VGPEGIVGHGAGPWSHLEAQPALRAKAVQVTRMGLHEVVLVVVEGYQ